MHYRLFLLNESGRFCGVVEREFAHDGEAVAEAEALSAGCFGVEVWCGERLVTRLGVNAPFMALIDQIAAVRRH